MAWDRITNISRQIQGLWESGRISQGFEIGLSDAIHVLKSDEGSSRRDVAVNLGIAWLNGMVVFRSGLALSCALLRVLRVSSANTMLISTPCGIAAVAFSSVLAAETFLITSEQMAVSYQKINPPFRQFVMSKYSQTVYPSFVAPSAQTAFFMTSGAIIFYIFGGRFRRVPPSDVWKPGSFARSSLPAPLGTETYAYTSQRHKMQDFGRRHGCHHCGYRKRFVRKLFGGYRSVYIGDHIPPNKFQSDSSLQRLYPQCKTCCAKQSTSVKTGKRTLIVHQGHRLFHLWMPLPILWMIVQPAWLLIQTNVVF